MKRWSLVVAALVFATPVSGQGLDGKQPLNQLPPIVSPDAMLANPHEKKSLFLPPIVQGNSSATPQSPPTMPPFGRETNLNQIVPPMTLPHGNTRHQNPLPPLVPGLQASYPQGLPAAVAAQNSVPRVSTAGIPIYPTPNPPHAISNLDYTGQLDTNVGQAAFSGYPQGSDTRNVFGNTLPPIVSADSLSPAMQQSPTSGPDVPGFLAPAETQAPNEAPGNVPMIAPSTVMGTPLAPRSEVTTEAADLPMLPSASGIAMPVPSVSTPSTPGMNDYFAVPDQTLVSGGQVVDTGCASCGQNGCYNLDQVQSQFGCCGSVVSAGYYVFADGLVWSRGDGDIQFSNSFGLNNFGWEGGLRFTLGYRRNATQGREFTYFGTGDLEDNVVRTSGSNSLSAIFTPSGGFGFGQVSGFSTANRQEHSKTTSVHSLEYNRVNWGWDVFKTILGVRYMYFDDDTRFFSTNGNLNHNGLFTQDSINNLLGVQGGFELFYDVGYRTSFSLTSKGGVYLNAANVDTNLFNFGQQFLSQDVDDASIASSLDFGVLSHFQLRPKARLRLGYDVLLMWGLFTVENNIPRTTFRNGVITGTPVINPLTGTELNTNNEVVVFHGLSLGFEFYR